MRRAKKKAQQQQRSTLWHQWYKGQYQQKPPKGLCCSPEWAQLRQRCLAPIREFQAEGEVYDTPKGSYIYRNNGTNVLAVAHLDVVQPGPRHFGHKKEKPNIIYNAQLDDRLGVWIILDVLPSMGIEVDTLLTEGEESCASTAEYFETNKSYNWMIEFDRGGTDVVMYDYETKELAALLEESGNDVGIGTYSDISVMEHLETAGFNWGIGYHDYHFGNSHFKISEYKGAIKRFAEFYKAHKDTKFSHIPYEKDNTQWEWTDVENERYTSGCYTRAERKWIRELEEQQQRAEEDREEEYRRQWKEAEEQRLWEESRESRSHHSDLDDCVAREYHPSCG